MPTEAIRNVGDHRDSLITSDSALEPMMFDEVRSIKTSSLTAGGVIGLVARGLPIFFCCIATGVFVGLLAVHYVPPSYTSSVSILIDPKRANTFGAEEQFASLAVDTGKVASVEQVLLSSDFLREVVISQHLADDAEFSQARTSRLRILMSYLQLAHADPPSNTSETRTNRAIAHLWKMIRVSRIGITYVMDVAVTARSAEQAQNLSSVIAVTYLADQLNAKYASAHGDAGWLQTRLVQLRQDLKVSEDAVEAIRQHYGLIETDGSPGSTMDRQMTTDLNAELARAEADVAVTQAKYQQAQRVRHEGGSLDSLLDVAGSKAMDDLHAKQADVSRHIADLSAVDGDRHPDLLRARRSLDDLNRTIHVTEVDNFKTLRNLYQAATERRDVLLAQLKTLLGKHATVSSAQGRALLREAQRVADVNRTTYEATLNHLRDVQQQETRQEPEARIISSAMLPENPSFPRPMLFLAGGAGLGAVLAAAIIALQTRLRQKVISPDVASADFDLTVLAMVPELKTTQLSPKGQSGGVGEYLLRDPFSTFAESFRRARLNLGTSTVVNGRIVQITSALPGEGKSTLATSLAFSASLAGIRTVLVDLDLRRPSIPRLVHTESPYGVLDVISGRASLESALSHLQGLPLTILAAGGPDNSTDPMESPRLKPMLLELADCFELVILDTSPVLATSDPLIVASLADSTILVVNWRMPTRTQVIQTIDALRSAGASISGMLLNKAWSKSDAGSRVYQRYYRDVARA